MMGVGLKACRLDSLFTACRCIKCTGACQTINVSAVNVQMLKARRTYRASCLNERNLLKHRRHETKQFALFRHGWPHFRRRQCHDDGGGFQPGASAVVQ